MSKWAQRRLSVDAESLSHSQVHNEARGHLKVVNQHNIKIFIITVHSINMPNIKIFIITVNNLPRSQ